MSSSPTKKLVATARSLSLPAGHHGSTELLIRPNIVARSHSIPHVEIDYISLDELDMPEMIRSEGLKHNTLVDCEPGDSHLAAIHYKDSWVAEGVDEEMNEMSGEKAQEQACISGQEQVIEDQAQEYSPAEAVSIIGGDERNELKRKLSQKEIDKYEVDYKRSKRDGAVNSKMENQQLDLVPYHQGLDATDVIRGIACSTCGKVVTSSKEWLIHVNKSFKEGAREGHFFRCLPCGEVFQSFKLFRLHILDTGHGMPESNDTAIGSRKIATSSRNFATSSKENPIQIDSDSDDGMENCTPTVAEGGMHGENKEDEVSGKDEENERMQEHNRSEGDNSVGGSNGESSRSRRSDSIFGRLKPLPGPQDGTFLRRLLEIERERRRFGVDSSESNRQKLPSECLNVEVRRIEPRDGPANEPGKGYHPLPPKPNVYPTGRGERRGLRGRVSVVPPKPAPSWGWY